MFPRAFFPDPYYPDDFWTASVFAASDWPQWYSSVLLAATDAFEGTYTSVLVQ